jgi:hypothetical protein
MKRAPFTARASISLFIAFASIALFAAPAIAEIFKCVDASGDVTFVNQRSACPDAKPHALKGRVDHAPSAATRAEEEQPDPREISSPEQRLQWALPDQSDVSFNWEIVEEMPTDPTQDADLVEWGVVAQRTRHYTRTSNGAPQVCSVELWAFKNEARARLAQENFKFPNWRIDRSGDTLVMLRALTSRKEVDDHTIYPDCEKLGKIARARADNLADE